MGVPEIVIGYRNDNKTLTRTRTFQTDYFAAGHPDWLVTGCKSAHAAIHTLRHLCLAHLFDVGQDRNDAIWRATVRHGQVNTFRLLTKNEVGQLRSGVKGPRLGLLPLDHVNQLRAREAWLKGQSQAPGTVLEERAG